MTGGEVAADPAHVLSAPTRNTQDLFIVEIPAEGIRAAQEARLLEIARDLNRAAPPATVPETVRRRFGPGVLAEILDRTIEAEVKRILSGSADTMGGQCVVEDLSFEEAEGLRFRLRMLPAAPQTLPATDPMRPECGTSPGVPARAEDRAVCQAENEVVVEWPDRAAENLLLATCPTEAQVGSPGRLPPGWWQSVPAGIDWCVSATGRDFGVPFVELHYRGVARAQSQITVRYGCREEARGVKRLWLELPWRLSAGAVPASCVALLVMGRQAADGAYLDTLKVEVPHPGPMNLVGQRLAAGFDGALGMPMPGTALWFTQNERVDFRLRLGAATLRPARTRSVFVPEE